MDDDLKARIALTGAMLRSREEPEALVEAGRHLSVRLYELTEDGRLWRALRRAGQDSAEAQVELAVLPLINWPPLLRALRYQEPPSLEFVAAESLRLLSRAQESPADPPWDMLREHLAWLASRLGKAAGEPWAGKNDNARTWLRFQVGQAWEVVRRLDVAKLLLGSAPTAADGALAAFAPPPVNLVLILTKLAVEFGVSATEEVLAARERRDGDASEDLLRSLVHNPAFARGQAARVGANFAVLAAAVEAAGLEPELAPSPLPPEVEVCLTDLDAWHSFVGAEVAACWGYVVLYRPEAVPQLNVLALELGRLAQAGRDYRSAFGRGDAAGALRAVDEGRRAQQRMAELVGDFQVSLSEFLPPHRPLGRGL
ncbi:MAG: hypothetical protein JWP61_547 [Friedmanniella sp.]|nr:hypothetical protein [Friedmanniella sp.]